MIPFITCEISLCQYVCGLVLGVNVFDLDFWVQNDSIKQPIKSNSVGPGNMSHCGASSLYDHLDYCFIVFKDVQQSFFSCKSGKPRKTDASALCTVDDTCCFHVIRLGPKTSVHEKHVSAMSTVTSCDMTNCATTLQVFNKHDEKNSRLRK